MKNKLFLRLLGLLFCFSLFGLFACISDESASEPQWKVDGLTLNYSSKEIAVYESFELKANTTDEVKYVVQNEGVVSVSEDGIVKGIGEGLTHVAVYAGENVAFCKVVVVKSDVLPEVVVNTTDLSLNRNSEFDLNPKLYFNGREEKVNFTLESSDSSIVEIIDGKLFAKALGETVVTVSTSFEDFGKEVTTKTVKVSVVPDVNLVVKNENLSLSKVKSVLDAEYENTLTLDVEVWIDGKKSSAKPTFVNKTESVISLNGQTVTAVNEGVGEVEIAYEHNEVGKSYEIKTSVSIEVYKPLLEKDFVVYVDSWLDDEVKRGIDAIELNPVDFFGREEEITQVVDVTSSEKTYEVQDNAIRTSILLGDRRWRVYTENYGVELNVKSASMIIKTAEDLRVFSLLLEKGQAKGYFCLGADINYRGERFGANIVDATPYFEGVFDGRNHTISNINTNQGFIRNFGKDGVIKNLALLDAFSDCPVAGTVSFFSKGTIENVYVDFTASAISRIGGIAFRLYSSKISNTVIDFKSTFTSDKNIAVGLYGYYSEAAMLTNVFISADKSRFPNKLGEENAATYYEENTAIYGNITELTAEQRATNTFTSVRELKTAYCVDSLDGNAYLTSNAPVKYFGAEVKNSTVFSSEPTDKKSYTVTAKFLFDETATTVTEVTTGTDLRILSTGYAIRGDGKSEYEVNVDKSLDVSDIQKYAFLNDRLNYRFNVKRGEGNSLKISSDLLSDGDNTVYVIDKDGNAYKIPFCLYSPISNAEDLTAALNAHTTLASRGAYILTQDIDMSGVDLEYKNFYADLFGNGFAIKNISAKNFVFDRYQGKMTNIRFENVSLTAASDSAKDLFQSLIKEILGGSIFENVYIDVRYIGGNFFSALGDANNAESDTEILLKNVVGKLHIVDGVATHAPSLIRKIQANVANISFEMKDCYLVLTSDVEQTKQAALVAVSVLNNAPSGSISLTIENDAVDVFSGKRDDLGTQYCYSTMSELCSDRKSRFVDAMWKDVIKYDENEFKDGYTPIANKDDLIKLIEKLAKGDVNDKYILTADIDASGVVANGVNGGAFRGEINGLGHAVTNLTIEGCLIKNMAGKMSNVAFINTAFKNSSGVNTVGLFNQVVNASVRNVYVDMKITLSESSESVFLAPFGGSVNSTLTLINAVAKIGFTADSTATPTEIGAVWIVNATDRNVTVNMNDVYLIKGENYGSNNSNGLVNWLRSRNSHTATVKVVNGTDAEYVQSNNTGADIRAGYAKGYTFDNYSDLVAAGKGYEKALSSLVFEKLQEIVNE